MKRLLLVFALLAVTACTGESNLPVPTGKSTIRAINTITASPLVSFLIEERVLGNLSYKGASVGARFDDLEYTFNFDVLFLGDISVTRVASQLQKIDANKDYTFVLTGAIDNPTITTWVGDERTWEGSETVFEVRFAHTAVSLGAIDVYFAPAGTAPAIGEQRGTLNFGEILAPIDIAAGNYVYTVTPSGDPATVLFQTLELAYFAQTAFLMPIYDGDETDTGSPVAQIIAPMIPAFLLPDAMALPTIRFIQASLDLPNSDVYDDAALTDLVLGDHAYGDVTGDMQLAEGLTNYTYTTVGNTSGILFEGAIIANLGTHHNFIVLGEQGDRVALVLVPDRRSVSSTARISAFPAALNHLTMDFYVVDADTSIDDTLPRLNRIIFAQTLPTISFIAGSYDLYLTTPGEKTVIAGPVRLDLALGDVAELIFFDTVDPATAEIRILPNP